MTDQPKIQKWSEMAALLKQGWSLEGFTLVSPTGEKRDAWLNAIESCRKRGLIPTSSSDAK